MAEWRTLNRKRIEGKSRHILKRKASKRVVYVGKEWRGGEKRYAKTW